MKTTYDTLPERIDFIISEISEIRNFLTRLKKPEEIPKYLILEEALRFLSTRGYPISKSLIYKLTSSGKIPHKKINNHLVFDPIQLEKWVEDKMQTKDDSCNSSNVLIYKSALKKLQNP